jgi:hypothetical protein
VIGKGVPSQRFEKRGGLLGGVDDAKTFHSSFSIAMFRPHEPERSEQV